MTYPRPLQVLHWSLATLVTCQLAVAVILTQIRSLAYGQTVLSLHRQLGICILLLVVVRFVMSRQHSAPKQMTTGLPGWQVKSAGFVHGLFYVLLVIQPIVGIFLAWGRDDSLSLFGLVSLPAPFEISDVARERLTTAHIVTAAVLFSLCVVHAGAVLFNRIVRRVSVLDRMLPTQPEDRLINRVPIATQLTLAFGIVIGIALVMGLNSVATYREFHRATTEYLAGDAAVGEATRTAQVAWKEVGGLAALNRADDGARTRELAEAAKYNVEDAATHVAPGEIKMGLEQIAAAMAVAVPAEGALVLDAIQEVDVKLQEVLDTHAALSFQHRTENDERAARGHDLIVVTVLPMLLAGLVVGLVLARSVTGSLSRMSTLIRSIESDRRDVTVQVMGAGEFAGLTREIVSMRVAVEERGNAAAAQRAQFEAERIRLEEEQQARELALERQQRAERDAQRERLAVDFEMQVAGIVDTVARTARQLSSTAGDMAESASATTERSRDASSIAESTSGTASMIASGTEELSSAAQSVRKNAEQSKARAVLAVEGATAAKAQIDNLVAAARQISTITDVIAGVARQTNLLAINARIEAARAGEVGRGFSVVANEVKTLAEQTHSATHGIGKQIEQVNSAAALSSERLQHLREVMEGLADAAAAIFRATDEQFGSTRDIATRVTEISESTTSVARNIRDAEETAGKTEQMSDEVMEGAKVMNEQALELREQVARFVQQLRGSEARAVVDVAPREVDATGQERRRELLRA